MGYRVGVDIGGSFTDFAILDEHSLEVKTLKVLSRPDQPGQEVITGILAIRDRYGIEPSDVTYFTHGTTVGVNTVIQRKGLKLALFTTDQFSDVLELGRLKLPSMYDLLSKRPEPLIARERVFGIRERLDSSGAVDVALDRASVEAAIDGALARGAEGIVIAFLNAYRNPVHELAAKRIVEERAPGLPVFSSAEVWPIIREFERTNTATIGGYVQPRVAHYLSELQKALADVGVAGEARLTKSNGGVMSAEQGKRECVQMILSGTAAGVMGAAYVCSMTGIAECMSLDVGGTSADVAFVLDGQPQYGIGEFVGEHQIFIPSVSVTSIGEGGGSIAWVDRLGVLKVGPESAGSTPGPACYGRGGLRPTITDAFAVCGIIGRDTLGYNAISVDRDKARTAMAPLALSIGKSVEATAEAIIDVAISGMNADVAALMTRFGGDPRSMTMLAFGGAGPMMGCLLARELDMAETLVPIVPGVLSALGGLIADLKNDFIRSVFVDLDLPALSIVQREAQELGVRARSWLIDEQAYQGPYVITLSADMRYRGQSFEVETVLDEKAIAAGDTVAIAEAFHSTHERHYGHADRKAPVQIVNLRLTITGRTPKPSLPRLPEGSGEAVPADEVEAWVEGAWRSVHLFRRKALLAGQHFSGPAIVSQDDTTVYVPPETYVRIDEFGNLRIRRSGHGDGAQ